MSSPLWRAWGCAVAWLLVLAAVVSRVHAQLPGAASAGYRQTSSGGSISGVVLDPDGRYPVPGARVYARYDGSGSGALPETLTDAQGHFLLTQVPPGPQWVVAEKKEEGYPDPVNAVYEYQWWTVPKVTVEAGKLINDVNARLFPKVGKLVVRVFDAATELPLREGYWYMSRDDVPELSMSGSSMFSEDGFILLLPPTACRVGVSVEGYKPWYRGGDGTNEGASGLVIPAGETRRGYSVSSSG